MDPADAIFWCPTCHEPREVCRCGSNKPAWLHFFEETKSEALATDWGNAVGVEDMYRAFKERLMDELRVELQSPSHWGRLVSRRDP